MKYENIHSSRETSEIQLWALREVRRKPGIGLQDLAKRIGIPSNSCSALVNSLTERGYVSPFDDCCGEKHDGAWLTSRGYNAISVLKEKAFLDS